MSKRPDGLLVLDASGREKFVLEHGAAVESLIKRYSLPDEEIEEVGGQIESYMEQNGTPRFTH